MGFFSKVGKVLRKVAKVALPVAAGALGVKYGLPALGNLFGGSASDGGDQASSAGAVAADQPQRVEVIGQKPGVSWAPIVGAAGQIASGVLNNIGIQQANSANAAMAQKQMDFQADQTSTAYQRGTADMRAAGLNPMLAYSQGGASSGSGAMATMANDIGPGANSAASAAQTLLELKNLSRQGDVLEAQASNIDADTVVKSVTPARVQAETAQSNASARQLEQSTRNASAALEGIVADSQTKRGLVGPTVDRARAEAKLSSLAIPRAANQAGAEGSWFKRNVSPYLSDIGSIINSAGSAARVLP